MATMTVLDSVGASQTVEKPLVPGQAARAASRPVTISTEDMTALTATQTISGTVTVNGVPTTALTRAAGAADANTLRVTMDTAQVGSLGQTTKSASVPVTPPSDYGVPLATDVMFAGTTALTPKFAQIAVSSSGDNSIVASVTSKKIRVLALKIVGNGAVNVKWRSATTDITGLSYFAAAGDGEVLPFNPLGWFETAVTSALQVNLSAAVAVGGHLTYIEV